MIQTEERTINPIVEKLGDLKVLLAEDNDVNQLLAKSILHHWGFETKIAVTGDEVLSLMEQDDFDVILMDIQMPEKSGIEACNEIRNFRDSRKKSIPIIALTANALKGEEKKYIAAGMDDFLTKPFKERDLYEVIERVLRKKGTFNGAVNSESLGSIKPAVTPNLSNERLYDLKQVEEIAAGNKDFIVTLINIFLETIPADCANMVLSSENEDWTMVSKLAHKLKSTIDTLNMTQIKTDIRTIELDAKKELNTEQLKKLIDKVSKVITLTAQQLKEEFSL